MSAASGVRVVQRQIHDLRASADIDETEARALRVQADQIDARVAESRRVADELVGLLPEGVRSEVVE